MPLGQDSGEDSSQALLAQPSQWFSERDHEKLGSAELQDADLERLKTKIQSTCEGRGR